MSRPIFNENEGTSAPEMMGLKETKWRYLKPTIGDWTNRLIQPENKQFSNVEIESGPRKNHSSGPNRGAWKLDGLLLKMTKMVVASASKQWPVSLNILNIETAWEKIMKTEIWKGHVRVKKCKSNHMVYL